VGNSCSYPYFIRKANGLEVYIKIFIVNPPTKMFYSIVMVSDIKKVYRKDVF